MKRLTIPCLAALALFLGGCSSQGGSDTSAATPKQEEMLKANREVQHAIETGDSATLKKYIADDAVDHGGGQNGADAKGEEIISNLAGVHKNIDNLKMETMQEAANGDYIFSLVHMTGTTNKAAWGMPANFKMDSKSVDVIRVKDMKMVEHWNFMDPGEMMKMMNQGAPAHMDSASAAKM